MIRRHPLLFLFVLGLLAALAWAWQNRIHLAAFPPSSAPTRPRSTAPAAT